jgi:hypothetical protein
MSEITREELAAFTDASTKSAVALGKVSSLLENISEAQSKCKESLSSTIDEKLENCSMARDIEHTKWLTGIIGFVVIVVTVMMRFMGSSYTPYDTKQQTIAIEHLIDVYNQSLKSGALSGQPIRRDIQPK